MHDVSPEGVLKLADRLGWSSQARARALQLALQPPGPSEWSRFLDRLLLAYGSLGLLLGGVFFIASNWSALGALAKFLLVDAAILGCALMGRRLGLERPAGQWAVTVSAGFVGAFLALYGQTYQTGADPYTLFLGWGLLITPWAVALQFAPLWALWLILLNVTGCLYFTSPGIPLALANGFMWVLAEGWKPRFGSTALAGVLMIGWATGIAWFDVIEAEHDYLGLAIWAVITAPGAWWCWTRRRRSLVTAFGLSSIGLLTTVLCRLLSWDDISDALLVGLAVLGQITVLVQLVRRLKEPQ